MRLCLFTSLSKATSSKNYSNISVSTPGNIDPKSGGENHLKMLTMQTLLLSSCVYIMLSNYFWLAPWAPFQSVNLNYLHPLKIFDSGFCSCHAMSSFVCSALDLGGVKDIDFNLFNEFEV